MKACVYSPERMNFRLGESGNMRQVFKNFLMVSAAIVPAAVVPATGVAYAQTAQRSYSIPAQDLGDALRAFGSQSGRDVVFDPALTAGKKSKAVQGNISAEQALRIMLEGSGLFYTTTSSGFAVRSAVGNASAGAPNAGTESAPSQGEDQKDIVVTGTHIRGRAPAGAPILIRDREDFDRQGDTRVQDVFDRIPQAFGSTRDFATNEVAQRSAGFVNVDNTGGSSINLRGLGMGTTLTLLDGRRLPRGGGGQNVMDTSLIPLAAVERVEILLDGASAIYGSDAIGGVVNFITRRNFSGGETRLSAGMSTYGDAPQFQIAQTLGLSGSKGFLLGTLSHSEQDSYLYADRPSTRSLGNPGDATPSSNTDSAYVTGSYEVAPGLSLGTTLAYTDRRGHQTTINENQDLRFISNYHSKGYGISSGVTYDIAHNWRFEAFGSFGRNNGGNLSTSPDDPTFKHENFSVDDLYELQALISGALIRMNGSEVKLVLGGGFRSEKYDNRDDLFVDRDRSVAAFGELSIPVLPSFTANSSQPGALISLAARYEKYKAWGDTFDPKIGATLNLSPSLRLRGTWGTSFKAPTAPQRTDTNAFYFITTFPGQRSIFLFGNNPNLKPETSTTWTAGLDFHPVRIPGLSIGGTYFNISYKSRIASPSIGLFSALTDPNAAAFVTTRAAAGANFDSLVSALLANPRAVFGGCSAFRTPSGGCAFPTSQIFAIIDSRLANLAKLKTSGFDIMASYSFKTGSDLWSANLDATYIGKYSVQNSGSAALVNIVDTPYRPLDFRANGNISWKHRAIVATVALNYADGYHNDLLIPAEPVEPVDSFTTVDLGLQYVLPRFFKFSGGMKIMANVTNLLNQRPPKVRSPSNIDTSLGRIWYDPANADLMGRYFKLALVGSW